MKKRNIAKAFTAVLVTAAAAFALFACDDGTQEPVKYTATYVSGATTATGTAPASVEKAEGETFTIANNTFTNEGFDFSGWSYGSTTYSAGDTFTMPASNVEFKAVWTAQGSSVTEYTVTYAKGADEATGDVPASVQKAAGAKFELPAVGTLANEGYTFAGWSDGENVYAAEAEYTMPAKAVTLTALWKLDEYGIADMLGVYAGDDMTLTVSDVEFTGFGAGGIYVAVTNGKSFTIIGINDDFGWAVSDMTSGTNYAVDYNSATEELTLIVLEYDAETESMVATNEKIVLAKTADYELTEAADFAGRYTTEIPAAQEGNPAVQMMWLINDDGTAIYGNKTRVEYTIVGNYLMITDMSFETANYILTLNDGILQGYQIDQESASFKFAELAFTESNDVLTLTVNGEFNQLVLKGSAPKGVTAPAAPDNTKEFDKWVLAGTTTEFDPTANMTADASITATFKDKVVTPPPAASKTYVGNCTYTSGSGPFAASCTYTSFTIDAAAMTVTYDCTQGTALTSDLTDDSNSNYKPSGTDKYYSVSLAHASKMSKKNFYLAISADGNTLTLCDQDDNVIDGGTFTAGGGVTPALPTYNLSMGSTSVSTLQFDNEAGKLVVDGTTYTGTKATSYDGDVAWDFSSSNPFDESQCTLLVYGNTLYVYGAVPSEASIEDSANYCYDKA